MKKIVLVFLAFLIAASVIYSSCVSKTNGVKNSSSEITYTLRFSTHIPEYTPQVSLYKEWAKEIGTLTEGKCKIVIYSDSTLVAPADVLTGLQTGIVDAAEIVTELFVDQRPLIPILSMPFMGLGSWQEGAQILAQVSAEYPELANEWSDFHVLFWEIKSNMQIHSQRSVKQPQDLQGVRVISHGALGDLINEIGGESVNFATPDWYLSLDKGLVNAMFMDWGAIYEMKCHEFLKFHTDSPEGISLGIGFCAMNLDTWNSLPPGIQDAITQASSIMLEKIANDSIRINSEYVKNVKSEDPGHTFITLTEEQAQDWLEVSQPVHRANLENLDAKGLPATKIYELAMELANH